MIVKVKQSPDASAASIGLNRYNRSVFPNTMQGFQPYKTKGGRWVTGLDENAPEILKLKAVDAKQYKEVFERVKEERESLELLTGEDLSATSKFWDDFIVLFRNEIILDLDDPMDKIRYRVMVANNYAAPNPDVVEAPEYVNTKFYISRTEEEESNKAKVKREKNRAIAELTKIEENKNRLLVIAKYIFGNNISDSITMDALYNMLSDYISNDKRGADIRTFLTAVEKPTEDIQIKLTIDEAIKLNIIRLSGGVYQRGSITYGKDVPAMIKYFSKADNSGELASIMEAVKEKKLYA